MAITGDVSETNHWETLPAPVLRRLSIEDLAKIIKQRCEDLFAGAVRLGTELRQPVLPTVSRRGNPRIRGFLPDTDSAMAYNDHDAHVGVVGGGDRWHVEVHWPFSGAYSQYDIDTARPEKSSKTVSLANGAITEESPREALEKAYLLLGGLGALHSIYHDGGPSGPNPDFFKHPDLRDEA